ncbi:hypothetical protein LTR62_005402 [Meristemomyces frigidus]|uniref:Cupin type-2 domain-containing protein n=1 Tax=Meristemomyces frigidus TaxID=1508187 RepID=A0AAN7YJD1_9PEZI|nr:hypothetical protein LTR62_005402 [Meristemomyces frigidus]
MSALAMTLPLSERIARTDPTKFRQLHGPHAGAGTMSFGSLYETEALTTNLLFLHRGVIPSKSGIGQHFHNQCEEMFVILDGEAQFTIDGRTSLLKGPVGVPCRMGHSHGIYNASEEPVQWLNVNVGMSKVYDSFDLGDPCTDVRLDAIPQFISMRLDRGLLLPVEGMDGGKGTVQYRRALQPTVFMTTWAYIDHLVVLPGASVGSRKLENLSEMYYVMSGHGQITVDGQTAGVAAGFGIPVEVGQERMLQSIDQELEVMIVGVARDMAAKAKMMAIKPL